MTDKYEGGEVGSIAGETNEAAEPWRQKIQRTMAELGHAASRFLTNCSPPDLTRFMEEFQRCGHIFRDFFEHYEQQSTELWARKNELKDYRSAVRRGSIEIERLKRHLAGREDELISILLVLDDQANRALEAESELSYTRQTIQRLQRNIEAMKGDYDNAMRTLNQEMMSTKALTETIANLKAANEGLMKGVKGELQGAADQAARLDRHVANALQPDPVVEAVNKIIADNIAELGKPKFPTVQD